MQRKIFAIIRKNCGLSQKLNYIKYLAAQRRPRLAYKPINISIVGTTKCTLNCIMCPTHSDVVPKDYKWRQTTAKDITFELFKKAVDRYKEAMSVHIIGSGEPMLNKDFFRMVDYAKNARKMEVKTFSNGTTIKENADKILKSGLDSLTVSVNSSNAADYKRITAMPEDIFSKIMEDTRDFIDRKIKLKSKLQVKLSFIIDRDNYELIPEMLKTASGMKADHVFLCNFLPTFCGNLHPDKRVIKVKDKEIADFIKSCKTRIPDNLKGKVDFPKLIDEHMPVNKCRVHFEQIRIDGDGNVSSCSMMLLNMENTGRFEDEDCWNSGYLVEARKNMLENKVAEELCRYCPDNKGVEVTCSP